MTENTENLILEHLRAIRGKVDVIAEDVGNMKQPLTSLETQLANVHRDMAQLHGDNAILHSRLDIMEKRIERRLDLTPAS